MKIHGLWGEERRAERGRLGEEEMGRLRANVAGSKYVSTLAKGRNVEPNCIRLDALVKIPLFDSATGIPTGEADGVLDIKLRK